MAISAQMVKELRERTGAGMLDCKKALSENEGNTDKAIEWLRKKGLSKAAKKAGRVAAEGLVFSYIHGEGRIGVLLEVNSETDFVARNEEFKTFVSDIAMHIAATNPLAVSTDEFPAAAIEQEKSLLMAKAREEGKKEEMLEKIVGGQVNKWLKEQCLLEQKFVKNPDVTVAEFLTNTIAKIGENIKIRRFVRYELGEGIEKKQEDFAAEVEAASKV